VTEQGYGMMRADGDRAAVRFERRYAGSPADVWAELTEPDRVRRWLAEVVDGTIEPGGEFTFRWSEDDAQTARCTVVRFDPAKTLELRWSFAGEPASLLRITLSPAEGDGTQLLLDHRQLPPAQSAGYGAGWHAHLSALAYLDLTGWDAQFAELLPFYRKQFSALG
jgi:uncharacterized protein YndB with AHSA1/START domain